MENKFSVRIRIDIETQPNFGQAIHLEETGMVAVKDFAGAASILQNFHNTMELVRNGMSVPPMERKNG